MVKFALLIGLNYNEDEKYKLNSSYNDILLMKKYLETGEEFDPNKIFVITDEEEKKNTDFYGTFFNIVKKIKELIALATSNDIVFIYFTGHGTQIKDYDNDEIDGKDEVFVPVNHKNNLISDDLIKELLKKTKAYTTILFDTCNSGTMADLKYNYTLKPAVLTTNLEKSDLDNKNIVSISSCNDDDKSFSAPLHSGNGIIKYYSKFTYYLVKHLASNKKTIVEHMNAFKNDINLSRANISMTDNKLSESFFLEKKDNSKKELMEITKKNMKSNNHIDNMNHLIKVNKKLRRKLANKNSIIERYKSALQLRNVSTLNVFSNILYDIEK